MRHFYVLLAVMATWVLFRADSLANAVHYYGALLGLGEQAGTPPPTRFLGPDVLVALSAAVLTAGPLGYRLVACLGLHIRIATAPIGHLLGLTVLFFLVTLSLAGGAYNPFIYFRF
jgi:alginate O-acetyltransferase complex protein AlgI